MAVLPPFTIIGFGDKNLESIIIIDVIDVIDVWA